MRLSGGRDERKASIKHTWMNLVLDLLGALSVVAILLLLLLLLCWVLMVMAVLRIRIHTLTLAPSVFFFFVARAESPPVLLVPGTQRLATKHEIVVFDNGGHHPRVAIELDFANGGI